MQNPVKENPRTDNLPNESQTGEVQIKVDESFSDQDFDEGLNMNPIVELEKDENVSSQK